MLKITIFVAYIVLIVFISILAGCDTDNPVCTDSFCLVPRSAVDDPNLIQIDESKALSFLETLAVDPVETPSGSVADIVSDTAIGGHSYEGRILNVSGTVRSKFTRTDGFTLETDTDDTVWFIVSATAAQTAIYSVGDSYDLSLYIHDQAPRRDIDFNVIPGKYHIFSNIVVDAPPIDVKFDTLIADAQTLNQRYQGRVVNVTATLSSVRDYSFALRETLADVYVYISRSQHPDESIYKADTEYDFTVFVISISKGAILNQVAMGLVRTPD